MNEQQICHNKFVSIRLLTKNQPVQRGWNQDDTITTCFSLTFLLKIISLLPVHVDRQPQQHNRRALTFSNIQAPKRIELLLRINLRIKCTTTYIKPILNSVYLFQCESNFTANNLNKVLCWYSDPHCMVYKLFRHISCNKLYWVMSKLEDLHSKTTERIL